MGIFKQRKTLCKIQEKAQNSRFLQNQKLELSGMGQISKPEVNVKLTKQIKWLKL